MCCQNQGVATYNPNKTQKQKNNNIVFLRLRQFASFFQKCREPFFLGQLSLQKVFQMLSKIQVGLFKGSSHAWKAWGLKNNISKLHGPDGGFEYVFICTPIYGEDEPILTSIFFKWVGLTTNLSWSFCCCSSLFLVVCTCKTGGLMDFWSFSPRPSWVLCHSDSDGGWRIFFCGSRCVLKQGCGEGGRETFEELLEETAFFCKLDAKIELLKKDVFLNPMMESGSTDFDVFLRMVSIEVVQWDNSPEPLGVTGKMKTPCIFNPTLGYSRQSHSQSYFK